MKFNLVSNFKPTGDQPQAIKSLVDGINSKEQYQTLLGVTGSGKTFTVANVFSKVSVSSCFSFSVVHKASVSVQF